MTIIAGQEQPYAQLQRLPFSGACVLHSVGCHLPWKYVPIVGMGCAQSSLHSCLCIEYEVKRKYSPFRQPGNVDIGILNCRPWIRNREYGITCRASCCFVASCFSVCGIVFLCLSLTWTSLRRSGYPDPGIVVIVGPYTNQLPGLTGELSVGPALQGWLSALPHSHRHVFFLS